MPPTPQISGAGFLAEAGGALQGVCSQEEAAPRGLAHPPHPCPLKSQLGVQARSEAEFRHFYLA